MEGHADPHSRYTLSPGHPVGGGGGGGGGGRGGSSIGGAISTGGCGGRTGRGAEKKCAQGIQLYHLLLTKLCT